MKICILSMQRVMNYGSLLQAYSLKKMVESLGHSVSFIDIQPSEADNRLREDVVEFRNEQRQGAKNLLARLLRQDQNLFFAVKKSFAKKKVQQKQAAFAKELLGLCEEANGEAYDLCIIGSDEVFNGMNNAPWGFTTQLFGNVPQAQRVITYAASCGFTTAERLSDHMKTAIKEAFGRISAFSVRDENTKAFVEAVGGLTPQLHLDPVAVGNFDAEIAGVNVAGKLPPKCCIIYAYHDRIHAPEEIRAIQDFCKEKGLTPVSVGGYQRWVHRHLVLSPFEVLAAFKAAECVITDTFHGALFSAKYAKHFAVMLRESNRNKLSDLVRRLGVEGHLLKDLAELGAVASLPADRAGIDERLLAQRERTMLYLKESL